MNHREDKIIMEIEDEIRGIIGQEQEFVITVEENSFLKINPLKRNIKIIHIKHLIL